MPVLITDEEIKSYRKIKSNPCRNHETCDTCKFYREESEQGENNTLTF